MMSLRASIVVHCDATLARCMPCGDTALQPSFDAHCRRGVCTHEEDHGCGDQHEDEHCADAVAHANNLEVYAGEARGSHDEGDGTVPLDIDMVTMTWVAREQQILWIL